VRPQRLEQRLEDWLRPGRPPMAGVDRANRRGSRKIPRRAGAGLAHWPGQPGGRGSWHTGIGDGVCRNDGRLRLVSRDRRLGGGRRRDRARIDAGCQASVRPSHLRSGVRHLQPSDWLGVACWPRLEPRPKDETAFLQAILEGVADVEALAYRKLAELGAPTLRSVRTVGGGAANSAWTKIRERKLKAPFKHAESQDVCAGVARLALQSLRNSG